MSSESTQELDGLTQESARSAAIENMRARIASLPEIYQRLSEEDKKEQYVCGPRTASMEAARRIIEELVMSCPDVVVLNVSQGNIVAGELGEVVFEWWYGNRKITVCVCDEDSFALKVPYQHAKEEDIQEVDIDTVAEQQDLWSWLLAGKDE